MLKILLFIHLLSLDVVFGAIGCYAFAARIFNQEINHRISFVLAIAVWIVYISDHLLDCKRNDINHTSKYMFFTRHKTRLLQLILMLVLIEGVAVFSFLGKYEICMGVAIGIMAGLYFLGQHSLKSRWRIYFPKEFIISFIYILAVWAMPALAAKNIPDIAMLSIGIHFMLVFTNVMLFSLFEHEEDLERKTVFTHIGFNAQVKFVAGFSIICFAGSVYLGFSAGNFLFVLPLLLISTVYFTEILFFKLLFIRKYYHLITDGAFLLLLFYLLPKFSVAH